MQDSVALQSDNVASRIRGILRQFIEQSGGYRRFYWGVFRKPCRWTTIKFSVVTEVGNKDSQNLESSDKKESSFKSSS